MEAEKSSDASRTRLEHMNQLDWLGLIVWVIAAYWQPTFGQPGSGSRAQYEQETTTTTRRPGFLSPPGWLFGVVWSVLYGLIAAAGFLYWSGLDEPVTRTMVLVLVNLVLNKLWTPIFFGFGQRKLALAVILAIVATNVWIQYELWTQGGATTSFWLWLPYTVWTVYATVRQRGQDAQAQAVQRASDNGGRATMLGAARDLRPGTGESNKRTTCAFIERSRGKKSPVDVYSPRRSGAERDSVHSAYRCTLCAHSCLWAPRAQSCRWQSSEQ